MPPGGNMGFKCFAKFYLDKNHKIDTNSTTTKVRKKQAHIWNPKNFRIFLMHV
jgi:hypothetical protein